MEEISTPVETASVDTSATSEPVQTETSETTVTEPTQPTETTAETTTEAVNQETKPEQAEKLYAGKYKSIEDLEKGYKEAEKSVTKVAELERKIKEFEDKQPKYVTEDGKFNPELKIKYDYEIDNREFLTYADLAKSLDTDTRDEVEKLLGEAQRLYNPRNKSAYLQKMKEAKNYFDSEIIENIAEQKRLLEAQAKEQMAGYEKQEYNRKAAECANKVKEVPELYNLVNKESPDFKPEVLTLLDAIFDAYQDVDIPQVTKVINTLKELGVKEYQKKQEFEQAKNQASVSQGNNVTTPAQPDITAEEATKNYQKYIKKFQKEGLSFADAMAKVDAIIMKG
jgi:antitoxin component HigA of HigAB toxin-antitoxin module